MEPEAVYELFRHLGSATWQENWALGPDWFAIRCPVVQGESERGAYETLFVTGINMTLCNQSQIDLIKTFLREKVKTFSEEVVPKQLWVTNKKSLILVSSELATWEKDTRLQSAPQAVPKDTIESPFLSAQAINTLLALFFALVLFGIIFNSFSSSFSSWGRHQQPKDEKLNAALASVSLSIGGSKEELAANILIEEGLLASTTAEKPAFSTHGMLMQISTLSEPISRDGTPFSYVSSGSFPVENALLLEVFGGGAWQPTQALKYRKFLYTFGLAWEKVSKVHEALVELPKEFVEFQPQIFRSILRNQSLFGDQFSLSINPPLTPFFRKQDALLARLLKQHFLGQDASFQGLLDPKDKIHREWRSRWQSALTIVQLGDLFQDGLFEVIKKNILDEPQLKSVVEHIGSNYGTDEAELKKWVRYRDQINEGNKAVISMIETILDICKTR